MTERSVKRWHMSDMPLSEYGLYTEVVLASDFDRVEKERDELRAFQELGMATRLGMYADVLKENARLREALEACIDAVDNDFIKSKTEDGETEYWVSHDMIKDIAYEALARDEAKQEDE